MKLINKNYKLIISFVLGAIIFGSIGVYAGSLINSNEVNFTPKNNKWNVTKVDEALNSLYSIAVPEEYTGTTSVTPTYSDITLSTQDKLVKNNITISGIPSTYKNLINTTTGTSADLASGKTLYNSDGSLITGKLVNQCTEGTIMFIDDCTTEKGCLVYDGFSPSKTFVLLDDGKVKYINYYDASFDNEYIYQFRSDAKAYSKFKVSQYFNLENGKFMLKNHGSAWLGMGVFYMACK